MSASTPTCNQKLIMYFLYCSLLGKKTLTSLYTQIICIRNLTSVKYTRILTADSHPPADIYTICTSLQRWYTCTSAASLAHCFHYFGQKVCGVSTLNQQSSADVGNSHSRGYCVSAIIISCLISRTIRARNHYMPSLIHFRLCCT